jgi:hypothetical protein
VTTAPGATLVIPSPNISRRISNFQNPNNNVVVEMGQPEWTWVEIGVIRFSLLTGEEQAFLHLRCGWNGNDEIPVMSFV